MDDLQRPDEVNDELQNEPDEPIAAQEPAMGAASDEVIFLDPEPFLKLSE